MSTDLPRPLLEIAYSRAAEEYLRNLPLEHFMEATPQARQREITIESLALVKARRSDLHYFNELLVQYPYGRGQKIRQVVPDNMVVLTEKTIDAEGSYDLPLQPAPPFWTLEYVSKHNKRKDYEDSFHKYERELKVPYYLLFYPDNQDLTLFHLRGRKYQSVPANDAGRHAIPELEIELALLDGWVRYWYQGELLALPAELERERDQARAEAAQERQEKERLLAQLNALGIKPL
jgi:Uma2 family endonuclease